VMQLTLDFPRRSRTFGPAYSEAIDGPRLETQRDRLRAFMLGQRVWLTLHEIAAATGYPEASVSAQLRHLRKARFGGFEVNKRRRRADGGTWEYSLTTPHPPQ
jgi:Fic family protein